MRLRRKNKARDEASNNRPAQALHDSCRYNTETNLTLRDDGGDRSNMPFAPAPSSHNQALAMQSGCQRVDMLPSRQPCYNHHRVYPANPWVSSYDLAAPPPPPPRASQTHLPAHGASTTCLPSYSDTRRPMVSQWSQPNAGYVNQGIALYDRMADAFNAHVNALDCEEGGMYEQDEICLYPEELPRARSQVNLNVRTKKTVEAENSRLSRYYAKSWLYANSRLPPYLPPFKVYAKPAEGSGPQAATNASAASRRLIHVPASVKLGTKAMVLKTHPIDEKNTIVLGIRGTANFTDWAVNFQPEPVSPEGFLDDPGNNVHRGFLAVAEAMVGPIIEQLRSLIQENPAWQNGTLIFTGHSAGGAVASLLYCHMLSQRPEVKSGLKSLAGLFKRIHCITFGTPPITLLPLQKPVGQESNTRWRKSLFWTFVNEGDPVARASGAFVRSLLRLYTLPAPNSRANGSELQGQQQQSYWPVPEATLSCPGRLILLRHAHPKRVHRWSIKGMNRNSRGTSDQRLEACVITDQELREVVFGDPRMHAMKKYASRVEELAKNAVTAGAF